MTDTKDDEVLNNRPGSPGQKSDATVAGAAGEVNANRESTDLKKEEPVDSGVILVDWDGPDDPENPKNWPYQRKWTATVIISLFTLISPVSSSMIAPATEVVATQFAITNTVVKAMVTSVFILAYAVGPLFLGPLSEMFGRSRVLQGSNLFYLIWNLVCGFAQNKEELIAFRFLAGLGGSAPLAVGAGALGDIWRPEERGRAIAVYSAAPLLGPVIGPIAGAWIAQRSTWRWVFWSTSIFTVVIQAAGLIFLRESYAPVLLEQKAARIRANMDPEKGGVKVVKSVLSDETRHWRFIFAKALIRPFALFVREPIIQLIGIYMAFIYGIFYLFLTTMPAIFSNVYGESAGIGGLNYLALGIGVTLTSQLNARYMDRIYIHFRDKNGGVGEPEFRVPSMIPGAFIVPVGVLLTGWAAEKHLHWVVTDLGIAFVGCGIILVFQSMQTFVIDAFALHAASALAAVSCLRSLCGFGFPLFAPAMYQSLGYGKGNTILAALSIAFGWPAPFIFWKYGKRIRAKSRYAKK